jgi:hypothetical protein
MIHVRGAMAEWLGKGLQSPVRRFDSGSRLYRKGAASAYFVQFAA